MSRIEQTNSTESNSIDNLSYIRTKLLLEYAPFLPDREKKLLVARQKQLVSAAHYAGHFTNASTSLCEIIKATRWDDILDVLHSRANLLEHDSHIDFYKPEWQGMIEDAIEGAAAKIAIFGMNKKGDELRNQTEWEKWLMKHNYTPAMIGYLRYTMDKKYIYPILPDNFLDLVGSALRQPSHRSQPSQLSLADILANNSAIDRVIITAAEFRASRIRTD